jgi:hypothetical protein
VIPINCLAVAAYICVSQPSSVEIFVNSNMSGATIKSGDVEIESITESDNLTPANLFVMKRRCLGSSCIHYTMHCDQGGNGYECTFYYVIDPSYILKRISFTGAKDKVALVLSKVGFAVWGEEVIPFSDLNYDNGMSGAPSCLPRKGCKIPNE